MKLNKVTTLSAIPDFLEKQTNNPNYLNILDEKQEWQTISTLDFATKIKILASHLSKIGIKKNLRVAIFAPSSTNWLLFDLACQYVGAITVPMFTNISQDNLKFQLKDSKVEYAFVSSTDNWKIIEQYQAKFKKIIIDKINTTNKKVIELNSLLTKIKIIEKIKIDKNDIATIIYTSGSTGTPKGVVLSNDNLISQIISAHKTFPLKTKDKTLSFLPLAHIFERMIIYFYLTSNISIYFADNIDNVVNLLQKVKPTIFTSVPRLLEKIYSAILTKTDEATGIKKFIAKFAINSALKIPYLLRKLFFLDCIFSFLVYRKFLAATGGKIKNLIVGGGATDKEICKFFTNIGLPIYQGYGLTETSPVISTNCAKNNKIGSVGKPFPNISVKISKDNEILAKGKNVMIGYLNKPVETSKTIKNGYLATGDRGYIDEDGFLFITGRIKELEKTSNGKYVAVNNIELILKKITYIDNAVVIANNRTFTSAIIFTEKKNLSQEKIQQDIDKINKKLDHWEQIKKFIISNNCPNIDNEELTPALKIRRDIILKNYKSNINKLYKKNG